MRTGTALRPWRLASSLAVLSTGTIACGGLTTSPPTAEAAGAAGGTGTAGQGGSAGTGGTSSGTSGTPTGGQSSGAAGTVAGSAGTAGMGGTAGEMGAAGMSGAPPGGGAAGAQGGTSSTGGSAGAVAGMSGSSGGMTAGAPGSSGGPPSEVPLPSGFCGPAPSPAPPPSNKPCTTLTLDGVLTLDEPPPDEFNKDTHLTAIRGPTPSAVFTFARGSTKAITTVAVGMIPFDPWGAWTPAAVGKPSFRDDYLALATGAAGDGTLAALMAVKLPSTQPPDQPPLYPSGALRLSGPALPDAVLQPSVELFSSGQPWLSDRVPSGALAGSFGDNLDLKWIDCDAGLARPILSITGPGFPRMADAIPWGTGMLLAVASGLSKGISTPGHPAPKATRIELRRIGGDAGDGSTTEAFELDGTLIEIKLIPRPQGAYLSAHTAFASLMYPVDAAGHAGEPFDLDDLPFQRVVGLGDRLLLVGAEDNGLTIRTWKDGVVSKPMLFPVISATHAGHPDNVLVSPTGEQVLVQITQDCSTTTNSIASCFRVARFSCADGSP